MSFEAECSSLRREASVGSLAGGPFRGAGWCEHPRRDEETTAGFAEVGLLLVESSHE